MLLREELYSSLLLYYYFYYYLSTANILSTGTAFGKMSRKFFPAARNGKIFKIHIIEIFTTDLLITKRVATTATILYSGVTGYFIA